MNLTEENMSDILQLVIKDPRFWIAFVGFVGVLIQWLVPNVPREVTSSLFVLITVIASIITGKEVITVMKLKGLSGR